MSTAPMAGSALIHMDPCTIRYSRPEPAMSDSARRIVRCAHHLRQCMEHPQPSAWFDEHVYDVDTLLRIYAQDYIDQAARDLDADHVRNCEAAAGRRFQQRLPSGGFCQAGVVAPPDSLMCEKTHSRGAR